MLPVHSLVDKRIWIIGASHGIGERLSCHLASEGATVIASGRDKSALKQLCAGLPGDDDHLCLPMDVQDERQVRDTLRTILNHYGVLDIVIYMAGVYSPSNAWNFSLPDARETININLSGIYTVLHSVIPEFIRQRHGHIMLTGSIVGYRGFPGTLAYGPSKAAVHHLAETLKLELSHRNIRVQIANPGFVQTRMTQEHEDILPSLITADEAAQAICKGLKSRRFEIHFPKRLTYLLKLVRVLPSWLYFPLARRYFRSRD